MNSGYYGDKQEGWRDGEQGQAGDGSWHFYEIGIEQHKGITRLKMKLIKN